MAHALSNLEKYQEFASGYDNLAKLVNFYSVNNAITLKQDSGHFVLSTCSMGILGSYVLIALVELPGVTRVVCINSTSKRDPIEDQEEPFEKKERGLLKSAWFMRLTLLPEK